MAQNGPGWVHPGLCKAQAGPLSQSGQAGQTGLFMVWTCILAIFILYGLIQPWPKVGWAQPMSIHTLKLNFMVSNCPHEVRVLPFMIHTYVLRMIRCSDPAEHGLDWAFKLYPSPLTAMIERLLPFVWSFGEKQHKVVLTFLLSLYLYPAKERASSSRRSGMDN